MLSLVCFSLYRDEYYHSVTAFAGVFTGHIDFTVVFLSGFLLEKWEWGHYICIDLTSFYRVNQRTFEHTRWKTRIQVMGRVVDGQDAHRQTHTPIHLNAHVRF